MIIAALTQVLWCRRTWLETTGNTFCQVGCVRVIKDDESFSASARNACALRGNGRMLLAHYWLRIPSLRVS